MSMLRSDRLAIPVDVRTGQQESTWCWAACAAAVIAYRGPAPTSQRLLVESLTRVGRGLCGNTADGDGLTIQELNEFFTQYVPATVAFPRALDEAALRNALERFQPVIVWFDWGLAHVCLVYGMVGDRFLLYDPKGPAIGDLSYDELLHRGCGPTPITWKYSWVM